MSQSKEVKKNLAGQGIDRPAAAQSGDDSAWEKPVIVRRTMPSCRRGFTPTHHSLLFGWLTRAVIERVGESRGEAIMRRAVQHYGAQRGRRMALRARAGGRPLSVATYMAYGEWRAAPGEMEHELVDGPPHARERIRRCPWQTAWQAHGLLPYGRIYCLEIDGALVHGFNPALRVDVVGTQTNGAAQCEFVFHDVDPMERPAGFEPRRERTGRETVMPWEYHVGHLFKTVEEVVVGDLGEAGRSAIAAGLADFARHFGHDAAQRVVAFRSVDFDGLP
jgi:L-2-amino-thiazoline-4-carboxylic acid hydrolase